MPFPLIAAAAGGGGGIWALLSKLLGGGMMGGDAAGGGPAASAAPAGGGMNLAGIAGKFGTPGMAGSVSGPPGGGGTGMVQGGGGGGGGMMSMLGGGGQQGGGGGGGGTPGKDQLLKTHQNITENVNGVFNGLRAFGQSLGGLDKTPLNNIPRNPAQIIYPQNNQNPGVMNLQALMAAIAGGAR